MDAPDRVTVAYVEHREAPGREEADAAERVGEPDPAVGLPGGAALGDAATRLTANSRVPTNSTATLGQSHRCGW